MKKIQILDSATVLKIAAGEVIERPASVVRELIDNSLDAEASWILVDIVKGGKERILVSDNGHGMNSDDLMRAYLNHSTSKITNFDDLEQLKTFGFRGEALASIAEISHLNMASRPVGENFGSEISINFGNAGELLSKGMNQGTIFTITDFFQNVPARLKFLGTETGEYRAIIQEFLKKALARPDVSFDLMHNSEIKYKLPEAFDLHNRIIDIFSDLQGILKPFSYQEEGIHVYGFCSNPSWYKPTRSYQYLFVNGRAIEWTAFRQQIQVAYNNLLPPSRFPAVFCYIELDSERIDFNVHPQKREIRFENERLIADVVRRAVRLGVESSQKILIKEPVQIEKSIPLSYDSVEIKSKIFSPSYAENQKNVSEPKLSFPRSDNFKPEKYSSEFSKNTSTLKPLIENIHTLYTPVRTLSIAEHIKNARYIGTIFKTYLLFEQEHTIYMIDFHAMHERIRYEKLLNRKNQKIVSQTIVPYVFETAKHEAEQLESVFLPLSSLGFEINRISSTGFSVESIPEFLEYHHIDTVLRDLLNLEDSIQIQDAYIWDSACKMIACKGSVKSGDSLTIEEINSLLEEWEHCENPNSCPHGRPIVVSLEKIFFDKEFKRTGF